MLPEIKDAFVKYLFTREDLNSIFLPERFTRVDIDRETGIYGIYGRHIDSPDTSALVILIFANGWTEERVDEWLRSHPTYLTQKAEKAQLITEGNLLPALIKRLAEGKLRKKSLTLKAARRPLKKRKRPCPPAFNLVQRNVPPTNRRLVGDTMFLADSWRGLFGRRDWLPRAAVERR